ncbi:MAG: hypothetical protein ACM3XN_00350 [Chloroflexota bacterium]
MKKADLFTRYLQQEGYMPKIDEDGDVVFKAEGLTYVLFAAEDDEEYFRLAIPNFWSIEDDEERLRVLNAAATVTAQMKVAKVQVIRDNVWASVEMLIDPIENFSKVFPRALRILQATIREFREAVIVKH